MIPMNFHTEANFAAIDFETATRDWNSACSVGVIVVKDGKTIHTYSSLIQPPENRYDSNFIAIHGIEPEQTQDAPTFQQIWPELREVLAGRMVVAHNASFDMRVLRASLNYYHLPKAFFSYFCSVQLARKIWPDFSSHSLSNLAQKFELQFKHHTAEADAWACSQVVLKAYDKSGVENMPALLNQCGLTAKKF